MRYPEPAPACGFAGGSPGDLQEVVRSRHRAEAQEWLALFRLFRSETDRLGPAEQMGMEPDPQGARLRAAEATCARWCVAAPVTVAATRFRLRAAIQLFEHLPLLAQAFLDGQVSAQLVKQIVDRTYEVAPQALGALDAALRGEVAGPIAGGARLSSKAIDDAVDEIVMLLDPDGVRTVRRAARAGIGVTLKAGRGGIAALEAVLPAVAGAAVHATVEALARRLHAGKPVDDCGRRLPLGRCRAVALLVLTAGRAALSAAELGEQALAVIRPVLDEVTDTGLGGAQVQVRVHATAEAAERPSDSVPVWIARLGLLPSAAAAGVLGTARRLGTRPGPGEQLRPQDLLSWLSSPLTPPDPEYSAHRAVAEADLFGRVAELNRTQRRALARLARQQIPGYALRYRIPDWLKIRVRERDGGCRFPGCGVPAADCDVDHLAPFLHRDPIDGGWTIEMNLGCLCRTHHRLKTHDNWTITTDEHAVFTFTAPDGTTAVTHPYGPAARIGLAESLHGPTKEDAGTPDQLSPEDTALLHAAWGEAGPWPENGGHDPTPTEEQEAQWLAEDLARARNDGWADPDDQAA